VIAIGCRFVLRAFVAVIALAAIDCGRPHAEDAHPDPVAPPPTKTSASIATTSAPSASDSISPYPPSCDEYHVLFSLQDADASQLVSVLEQLFDRKRAVHPDARARFECTLVTIHNEGCVELDEAFRQSAEALRAKGLVVTKTAKTIDIAKAPGPGCAP
jgi:hypothetical protein